MIYSFLWSHRDQTSHISTPSRNVAWNAGLPKIHRLHNAIAYDRRTKQFVWMIAVRVANKLCVWCRHFVSVRRENARERWKIRRSSISSAYARGLWKIMYLIDVGDFRLEGRRRGTMMMGRRFCCWWQIAWIGWSVGGIDDCIMLYGGCNTQRRAYMRAIRM